MATKKAPSKKAPTKTTAKSSPKKKATRASAKKTATVQSFKVVKDAQPFVTFKITRQTLYWLILLAVITISQLWILKLQIEISALTDAITALQLDI